MPPIEIRPNRQYSCDVYGTQFGVFVTSDIAANVLIGQHGCDVLNGRQLSQCRKNDCIRLLSEKNSPYDVYLAPKDFCSYTTLINSGSEETSNCKAFKCVVNGSLRLLVYTSRNISKDQQLLYEHRNSYKFHWNDYMHNP